MGLFGNEVRREFIARPDAAKGQILYKWPDTNIRKLTQLTVEQDVELGRRQTYRGLVGEVPERLEGRAQ